MIYSDELFEDGTGRELDWNGNEDSGMGMRIVEWEWEYWYKNEDTLLVMLKLCKIVK